MSKKQFVRGMMEDERCQRWIAECRWESLNVTRHTRVCSKHFKGGLGPTKTNPIPTIFDFPKHLQRSEATITVCLETQGESYPSKTFGWFNVKLNEIIIK